MTELAPIVVGIDGGAASVAALELALREAQLRHTNVLALTCFPSRSRRDDAEPLLCSTYEQATELLEHVIELVQRRHPQSAQIIHEVEQNYAGPALVAASRSAELLVLGSTTRGPFGHHHRRNTLEYCLLYSEAPVVVVPWTPVVTDGPDIDLDRQQASTAL